MFYGISPDVYLADVDGDLVLLDARANAYFCVPRGHARGLKPALIGSNRFRPSVDMLDEFEAAGLFSMLDAPPDAASTPFRATTDLYHLPGMRAELTPSRLALLVAAAGGAQLDLRLSRPNRWLRKIARRNARATQGNDVSAVHALARLACDAQPFFPAMASCLPSSLFLLHLLHRHGLQARWVFGVRTYPFEAHCWVEHGEVVLNDSLEHVRWFTPIVAV
ncbi:MAG: lasso peptide biosynthesis B2 protein [Sphingomonas sp.]